MSQSNKLFKWTKYNGNNNSNAYDSDAYDSDAYDSNRHTNINKDMFSSILRHPYIEHIAYDNLDIHKNKKDNKSDNSRTCFWSPG